MIYCPCVLKLDGDAELMLFKTEMDFLSECQDLILDDNDYVVDSEGAGYRITFSLGQPTLVSNNQVMDVSAMTQLIQAHEFNKAEMCITKIHFSNISDAIRSLFYIGQ